MPLILLVFGFVFFAVAAAWNPEPYRYRLVATGLAFWVLAEIVTKFPLFR